MAASSADLRDILALPGPSTLPAIHSAPKKTPRAQKPEGISRELYSLIGNHAPSLAAVQQAKAKLKQKPKFGRASKTYWEWRTFTNQAREDGLQLGHWEKVTEARPAVYPFAKYNTSSNVYAYTNDEYSSLLTDEEWTKEETDYLFNLIKEYDMRWFIILDRYDYSGGPGRTLEDLKARYYSVCRKLIRNRPWSGDEATKSALLNTYQFDKEREKTRKMYVASLFARTPEQIAEEEALYVEIKKLEQKERRFAKERDELMRVVAGIESGLHIHQPDEEVVSGLFVDPKKRKKKPDGTDAESPAPGPSTGHTKKAVSNKQAHMDQVNCVTRLDTPPTAASTKAAHIPAHLRSSKLPYPKPSIAPKVIAALTELGINTTRLVMPTKENIQRFESLLDATAVMIDMKKAVDRVDQEIRTQKKLLGMIAGEDSTTPAHGGEMRSGEADSGDQNKEDVKEETSQSKIDVDREPSIVPADGTTEGAPPQQSHKRSLSISSVDTSATTATRLSRGNTKRPRKT